MCNPPTEVLAESACMAVLLSGKQASWIPMPRVCALLLRGMVREKGMSQAGQGWLHHLPLPLQRKPEGLAQSPEAPGRVFSTPIRQFQGRLAGWLCRPAGKQLPTSCSQQWSLGQLAVLSSNSAHPQAVLPELTWQRRRGSLPNTMAPQ